MGAKRPLLLGTEQDREREGAKARKKTAEQKKDHSMVKLAIRRSSSSPPFTSPHFFSLRRTWMSMVRNSLSLRWAHLTLGRSTMAGWFFLSGLCFFLLFFCNRGEERWRERERKSERRQRAEPFFFDFRHFENIKTLFFFAEFSSSPTVFSRALD